jgi:CheY-like chemotaxis protein
LSSYIHSSIRSGCTNPECDKKQILIIDDNNFNILALEMQIDLITPDKFLVTPAFSGAKALEKLRQKEQSCSMKHSFNIVFVDYNMPLMNGLEVTILLYSNHFMK